MKRVHKLNNVLFAVFLLLLALGMASCAGGSAPDTATPPGGTASSGEGDNDGGNSQPAPVQISMGTHSVGSSYHAAGAALAKLISDHSHVQVTVKPYIGPNAWMPVMMEGGLDIGVISEPDVYWAVNGIGSYAQPATDLRLLAMGTDLIFPGVAVRQDSGITKTTDLRGKRVGSDYAGNQVLHLLVEVHLASVGLTWDDVQAVPVADLVNAAKALREGRVDAAWVGGPTAAAALEADSAVGITALSVGDLPGTQEAVDSVADDVIKSMQEKVPGIVPVLLPGGTGFIKEDTVGMSYKNTLVATKDLPDEIAYAIVEAIWNHHEELADAHAYARGFTPENLYVENPPTEYHPGALQFYRDKGVAK